jgi:hypothetical protein
MEGPQALAITHAVIAQLAERCFRKAEVAGSMPVDGL